MNDGNEHTHTGLFLANRFPSPVEKTLAAESVVAGQQYHIGDVIQANRAYAVLFLLVRNANGFDVVL